MNEKKFTINVLLDLLEEFRADYLTFAKDHGMEKKVPRTHFHKIIKLKIKELKNDTK